MTNREKIIVGLMLLVVVYGVYTLFLSPPPNPGSLRSAKQQTSLNAFVTKVAEKSKIGLSKKQTYIMEKAQAAWKKDPFIQISPQQAKEEKIVDKPAVLTSSILYTGFLQMGDTRLAIINGIEYEAGDKLEPGGFVIQNIHPNHVVIAPADRKNKTMILPMEESE